MLREHCLDINHSATAIRYLAELGREDAVPAEANEPDFQAKAEFANWLAHPNELGRPPDELEILDRRTIDWPPAGEETSLWLIKYRLGDGWGLEPDDVDCGLVGSTTWCFFNRTMHQRLPDDCYAIHCCWELGLEDSEVDDPSEYEGMLKQWPHSALKDVEMGRVVEVPPKLGYGRRLVAVASAAINGERGWAVLDGPDSVWYPAEAMPEDEYIGNVLSLHVGRKLLGIAPEKNRSRVLDHTPAALAADEVVTTYDRLLEELQSADLPRRKALVADWRSPLGKTLKKYSECCEQIGWETRDEAFARVFRLLIAAVQQLPAEEASEAYDLSGPISDNFEEFVRIATKGGEAESVQRLVLDLEPHWDHNLGYRQLGAAAYQAGDSETAERLLLKLKESYADSARSEEMGLLARVWHEQGRTEQARELLVGCLRDVAAEAARATGSDRKLFEEWFQSHRSTYSTLFGDDAELRAAGLPDSTLN